jgi:HK97 family phage major capsid protein
MPDIQDIVKLIDSQGGDFKAEREANAQKFKEVEQFMIKLQRPNAPGLGTATSQVKSLRTVDGRELPLLSHEQKAADLYRGEQSEGFNLGDFARAAIVGVSGQAKAQSGPALVPVSVGSQIIDRVRAQTVVIEAGAGTLMIGGPTNLARLTSDPTVHSHTEAVDDIDESDVLAAPIALNPKTLACLVPLTLELVMDSPNLDGVLSTALAGAFAAKLDSLALATLLADTDIPHSAAGQDPALWAKVLEAVGSALALNQRVPSAHISAPADWIARASQLASTSGSWLGRPPALASMAELQTTGLSAGTALFGDFAAGFAVAMRSALTVEVVRFQRPGKATCQVPAGYKRAS